MIKERLKNILTKIKNNKKKVIGVTAIVFAAFIFTFTVYNLNNPTKFNRLFANVLNNGKPVNDAFEDNAFYSCVIDNYNSINSASKAYTDNLTDEELASITSLECSAWSYSSYSDNNKIVSAKGIEKLTGLTFLNLNSNQLTSIDLSANTNLTNVSLYSNQLTSINLSNDSALTDLNLNNNQLTYIDLSNNTALTTLYLTDNQLTSIDLSNNISLQGLYLDNNNITSLDLSNNASLSHLYLLKMDLSEVVLNSNLYSLILGVISQDLNAFKNITSIKQLTLSKSSIGNLELENFKQLERFDIKDESKITNMSLNNDSDLDFRIEGDTYNKSSVYSLSITNTSLSEVILSNVKLNKVFLSKNYHMKRLDLSSNELTSIDLSDCYALEELDLYNNNLKEIDLSNNSYLKDLDLSDNQLTNIDLSNLNTSSSNLDLDLDDNPLIFDILMKNNETLTLNEKIKLPAGDKFEYVIDDKSIATIDGNNVTALKEGATTIKMNFINSNGNVYGSYQNKGYVKNLVVGKVELSVNDENVYMDKKEKYIYVKNLDYIKTNRLVDYVGGRDAIIRTNVGELKIDGTTIKVLSNDTVLDEYKLAYFDSGYTWEHTILSSINNDNNYNIKAVNCEYNFTSDNNEIIISHNGKELERKKVIYMFLPSRYRFDMSNYYLLVFDNENLKETDFKTISNLSEIDKDKISILNYNTRYDSSNGRVYLDNVKDKNDSEKIDVCNVSSKRYDLSKDYIYLGNKEFVDDIMVTTGYYGITKEWYILNDTLTMFLDESKSYEWKLIKESSDIYDLSSDTIDLNGTELDLSKINVTNATLKLDGDKLYIISDTNEVVREIKIVGAKKNVTTTTKKDDETTTTTNTTTKTTKKEVKATTTKKKVNIIDKIFGNKETTTVKKEDTTTKKNIFRKSTTTKVENSSGNVTSNNKNSFKKLVTGSNLLILFLSITGISIIIYIIIDKKKNKFNN